SRIELLCSLEIHQRLTEPALPLSESCPSFEQLAVVGATRLHNREFPQRPVVIQKTEPVVSAQGVVCFRQIRSQLQGLVDRSLRCCEPLRRPIVVKQVQAGANPGDHGVGQGEGGIQLYCLLVHAQSHPLEPLVGPASPVFGLATSRRTTTACAGTHTVMASPTLVSNGWHRLGS